MGTELKNKELHERFVKWDGIRRNYFTVVINLLWGISFGLLMFLMKELQSCSFNKSIYFTTGLILAFVSAIFGSLNSVSRFFDFRYTARNIRLQEKQNDKKEIISSSEIESAEKKKHFYETLTMKLFYAQIVLIILTMFSIVFYVLSKHSYALF